MGSTSEGLIDKLYWRKAGGLWHCFEKTAEPGFVSLCRRQEIQRVHGQEIARPDPVFR
jgi:hypothetical protein